MNPVIQWLSLRITQVKAERDDIEAKFIAISEKKAEVNEKLRALEIGLEDARRTSGVLTPLIADSGQSQDEQVESDPRTFTFVLHKSMYNRGYINIPRASDHLVVQENNSTIRLLLPSGDYLKARLNRELNRNGTARIVGNAPLRDWFKESFVVSDGVVVHIIDPHQIQLNATRRESETTHSTLL